MRKNVEYILSLRDRFTNNLRVANSAVKSMERSTTMFQNTLRTLVPYLTIIGSGRIVAGILKLGMDMEQTNIAFEVMLGNAQKAKQLLGEMKEFAAKTPFQLTDVIENAKQLLAYGFAQEEILTTMRKLGDVAAGLKIPFGDLTYLYGTLRASGRVMSLDLRQFAMRGIPIYEELAKVLRVDRARISEMVKEGKVGFNHIEEAFNNMTNTGGRFANLMERLSKTTAGRISNLKDIFIQAGITLGQAYLPQVNKAINIGMQWAKWIMTNTDTILKLTKAVITVVKFVFFYKTVLFAMRGALMLANIAHRAFRFTIIAYNRGLTSAITLTHAFNSAMKMNVIAMVVAGVAMLIMKLKGLQDETRNTVDTFEMLDVGRETIEKITKMAAKGQAEIGKYSAKELQAAVTYLEGILEKTRDIYKLPELRNKEGVLFKAATLDYTQFKISIRKQLDFIQRVMKEKGLTGVFSGGGLTSQETNITSSAPKVINININNLIGEQTIETQTLKESAAQIKKIMIETLMDGLNDAQIMIKAG